MKLRTPARLAIALLLVLVITLLACVDTVDYTPYFKTPYYQRTMDRLRVVATNTPVHPVPAPLRAGFGKSLLTPQIGAGSNNPATGHFRSLPLAGYGDRRGKPAEGVQDDLHVKAVALQAGDHLVAMVAMDALIVPREVADLAATRAQKELGLARGQLYLSATHTHCGPGGWGSGVVAEMFGGDFVPETRPWMADRIIIAVSNALANLQPASLGHTRFEAPDLVRNRLVGHLGRIDPLFTCLLVRQDSGAQAVIGAFAAHATVLSGKTMHFSGDYPGFWQREVEAATGAMALFMAGAVGSHSPVPGVEGPSSVRAEALGKKLAAHVTNQLHSVSLTNQLTLNYLSLDISMPPLSMRVTDSLRLRPWLAAKLLPAHQDSFLQAVRVHDTIWVATPCDFSGELALDLRDQFRVRGHYTVFTSFNGDYIGYVVPTRYYHLPGYEPRVMNFFGPNVTDYLTELIRTMTAVLSR